MEADARTKILLPSKSLGWAGGDVYLKNLERAVGSLEAEGFLKQIHIKKLNLAAFVNFSKAGKKVSTSGGRRASQAIQMPWPITNDVSKPLQWIPDLQDIEEPQFFDDAERLARKEQIENAIGIDTFFYFSSKHAQKVFSHFYPRAKTLGVLRFAVEPITDHKLFTIDCEDCHKYGYFYSPNTWWVHKNHILLLNAYSKYRGDGGKKCLVLSGTKDDYRWPKYRSEVEIEMKSLVHVHDLEYLTKQHQAFIFANCHAVIQPSLYEGWSTTVEEALIHNKFLIVSNLQVFSEQLEGEKYFLTFNRFIADDLAQCMKEIDTLDIGKIARKYSPREARFIEDLRDLINVFKNA